MRVVLQRARDGLHRAGRGQATERGLLQAGESFAPDRLGDAVARVYERYAELLPEGPERTRAAARARSAATLIGGFEPDRWVAACAPEIEAIDHRPLATHSARGVTALLHGLRAWLDLAEETTRRFDDVLGLRSDAILLQLTFSATDRTGGGAFERIFLVLAVFGDDGLMTRVEWFDADREAEALARFDELSRQAPARPRIVTTATRSEDACMRAWEARDPEAFAALFGADFRSIDRRPLMHLEVDREAILAAMRPFVEMGASRSIELLATRGERLTLHRLCLRGSDDLVGPSEVEILQVVEVDASGARIAAVAFDPGDLDLAYAELDARYAAGEAAPYARGHAIWRRFNDAWAARGWDALAASLAPEFRIEDHRKPGLLGGMSRDDYVASARALVGLRPDVRLRIDHVLALDDRRSLQVGRLVGAAEDGSFETAFIRVLEFGSDAIRGIHMYELDDLDAARARYEAIGGGAPRDPLAALMKPNAATAAMDRLQARFEARDWAAVRALAAECATFQDRRRRSLVSGDANWWVADLKQVVELNRGDVRFHRTLVATAGDRVCLEHVVWTGGPADGPVELECLWLAEVDESGRFVAGVLFDVDDRRAALREGLARRFARDAAAAAVMRPLFELAEAWNDHDRARMRAALADDLVVDDRRLTGQGRVDGADAYLETVAALWELAPDEQNEPRCLLAVEPYGAVAAMRGFGSETRFGGAEYEVCNINVATVAGGRVTRLEFFDVEDGGAALARLAELRPDPLRIPPNAATRAVDRVQTLCDARDWAALEALCAPTLEYDDRRRGIRTSGDRDAFVESRRLAFAYATLSRTRLATAGDRLALEHFRWTGVEGRVELEVETVTLLEIDAEGRLVADIGFDPDDRRAASVEMTERFLRQVSHVLPPAGIAAIRVFVDHDLARLRAVLPDDFTLDDRRRTGVGRIEGADAWVESLAAIFEQAPDLTVETLYTIAADERGVLEMARMFGTLAASGGAFEGVYLRLLRAGRRIGFELFEPEDLELARARFAELGADGPKTAG